MFLKNLLFILYLVGVLFFNYFFWTIKNIKVNI